MGALLWATAAGTGTPWPPGAGILAPACAALVLLALLGWALFRRVRVR